MLTSALLPPREGMGFYIWNLSRQLDKFGHSVQIITRGSARSLYQEIHQGITIWKVPFLPIYPLHVHIHSLFVNRQLRDLEQDLDLLHLHTPLIKHPVSELPTLVTVHTPMKVDSQSFPIESPYAATVKLQIPFSIRLEQEIFSKAEQITAVSKSVAQELTSYGINGTSVDIVGNGVDPQTFTIGDNSPGARPPNVLTVCRLGPRKGLEDLIACARQVVERCPHVQFYIAGDGPYKDKIRREIQSSNLSENVILLGHISDRKKLVEFYQGATAFVHPAHYEGLPTVLLEAMSCGCPVVATAVSGALDVVEDGKNGLLVPPHNPRQMAEAIFRILNEPSLGEKLGKAARNTVEERYSWQVVSKKYLAHYERLIGTPGHRN